MFEYWPLFTVVFAGFIGMGILIYLLGNRKTRHEERKKEVYTCGEPFPAVHVGPENFYGAIKKNLGVDDIRKIHSGKLSDYLLWLVIGVVAVLLAVLFI